MRSELPEDELPRLRRLIEVMIQDRDQFRSQLKLTTEALTKLLGHLPPYDDEGKMTYAINLINETLEKVEK